MATEQQTPISASAAVLEPRWPKGGRGRQRAAPEAAGALGQPQPDTLTRAARAAGGLAGSGVRLVRRVRARASVQGNALDSARAFVNRRPSALLGAGVAGFLTGRLLKRH